MDKLDIYLYLLPSPKIEATLRKRNANKGWRIFEVGEDKVEITKMLLLSIEFQPQKLV